MLDIILLNDYDDYDSEIDREGKAIYNNILYISMEREYVDRRIDWIDYLIGITVIIVVAVVIGVVIIPGSI